MRRVFCHYRAVSVLPLIAKILHRLVDAAVIANDRSNGTAHHPRIGLRPLSTIKIPIAVRAIEYGLT